MVKNPYKEMTKNELKEIYKDYIKSKEEIKRCESFVPYAKEIKENIGGDFSLRESIDIAKKDFFEEVLERYFKEED